MKGSFWVFFLGFGLASLRGVFEAWLCCLGEDLWGLMFSSDDDEEDWDCDSDDGERSFSSGFRMR